MSDADLERIVQGAFVGARVAAARPLDGGISSGALAVTAVLEDGSERRVVVRRPSHDSLEERQRVAQTEFEVLGHCLQHGIPVPRPRSVDVESATIVLDFVEGAPDFAPADVGRFCQTVADQLAAIHRVPLGDHLPTLKRRAGSVATALGEAPRVLDASLREAEIRKALERLWPWPQHHPDVLLHGDYWPGNLLWEDGHLVSVLDWEECERGDPLADVSVARLDVLWAYGADAMETFTKRYRERTGVNHETLPLWDLCAALRPMSRLAQWASVYARPPILRPDVTEASMRAGHHSFVEQALSKLRERGAIA